MEAISGIITALGVDWTFFVQLGIFLFVLIVLNFLVFNPYYRAFNGRQSATVGNTHEADKIYAKNRELESVYQRKARGLNLEVKEIFDKARLASNLENEKITSEAREKARNEIEKTRTQLNDEFARAREELVKEIPALGEAIAVKLVARSERG